MGLSYTLHETIASWPDVPNSSYWVLLSFPFLTLVACVIWLRVLWPCPDASPKRFEPVSMKIADKTEATSLSSGTSNGEHERGCGWAAFKDQVIYSNLLKVDNGLKFALAYSSIEAGIANSTTATVSDSSSGSSGSGRVLEAGEVAGDYSRDWKGTFDMTLLVTQIVWLGVNIFLTHKLKPELFANTEFWMLQIPKLGCMIAVSILAGLLCRHFCPADENGYIMTSKNSWFKVNYTRKVQHFAAYLVPLLFTPSVNCDCKGTLELSWGVWATMIGFLVMIKPVRETIPLFMLQFNGLDRPEDRPHTLEWIIKYNIWPGEMMIVFFAHLFASSEQRDLVYILVFVTGVGDGLAEPVGIFLGKHKYMARSCESDTYYQRSFEGSCCVFIVTVVTVIMVYASFASFWQFLVALLTLPLALTLAEAFSPHTMDTPFIMGVGGAMLYAIVKLL